MGPPGGRLCTRLSEHSATARAVTRDSYRSWPGTGKFRAANQGRGSLECGGPLASLKLLQARGRSEDSVNLVPVPVEM